MEMFSGQIAKSLRVILAAIAIVIIAAVAAPPSAHARVTTSLARRVYHAMQSDRRLRHVRCESSGHGTIVLNGTVFDDSDRALAEATASRVRGVRKVVNDLQTQTGQWAQEQAQINHALAANGLPLSVLVIGPKAYLSGEVVGDSEQARAFTVINSVSNLQVVNFSRVVPGRVF